MCLVLRCKSLGNKPQNLVLVLGLFDGMINIIKCWAVGSRSGQGVVCPMESQGKIQVMQNGSRCTHLKCLTLRT